MITTAEKRPDVRELRYLMGDTLVSLSEKLGVTVNTVAKWEQGSNPVSTTTRLAYAYIYEIEDLDEVDWDLKRNEWLEEQESK